MGNPVMQWQILSTQPEATAKFYGKLFGWNIDTANAMGYRVVKTGDAGGIDGGIWPAPPQAQSMVQLFIQVANVSAHLEKAVELGAKVLVPRSVLPDGDVMAIMLDPAGMPFGIVERAAGG